MNKMTPALETVHTGLTAEKAQARLAADGPNELATTQRRSPFRIVLGVLKEPMLVLLLANRQFPSGRIVDQDRKLRVVFEPAAFAELACSAFAAIARYGISDDDLVERLLDVMEKCSRAAPTSDRQKIMRLHDAIRLESDVLRFGNATKATQPTPA
jgi:hypothetical protein